jgi:hypothetical protein
MARLSSHDPQSRKSHVLAGNRQATLLSSQRASMTACKQSGKQHVFTYCLPWPLQACYPSRMIIAVANSKGGVGKSTLSVHLAAWLQAQGHRVVLADCDSQQSSSEWIREAAPDVRAVRLDNPDTILNELPSLCQEADYVVADGPGSQTETSRALLLRADLASGQRQLDLARRDTRQHVPTGDGVAVAGPK